MIKWYLSGCDTGMTGGTDIMFHLLPSLKLVSFSKPIIQLKIGSARLSSKGDNTRLYKDKLLLSRYLVLWMLRVCIFSPHVMQHVLYVMCCCDVLLPGMVERYIFLRGQVSEWVSYVAKRSNKHLRLGFG